MVLLINYGSALLQLGDGIAQAYDHTEIIGGFPDWSRTVTTRTALIRWDQS
ncbi:hypothetical protein [Rhizobium sp. Leaf262]|uniref:hypothetical protein n=1 Tax=Rhizobium sp. Leaf262 TaxID=1736312 RepID=UPI000B017C23|nr:hypothetical protein [Rhizobium sp. Leaf262]